MRRTNYTARQKAEVLRRHTLRIKDICVLFDCGYRSARKKADQFQLWFEHEHGYSLYDGQIPTTLFLKYYEYDESRVLRYARLGL